LKKVVVVAALPREIAPLVKGARRTIVYAQNRTVRLFEMGNAVYACGGIGVISARVAADVAYKHAGGEVSCFISAGFAGALIPELRAGDIVKPAVVINETDEVKVAASEGRGVLVTSGAITDRDQKRALGERYSAQAVDMEAYAVVDVANIYKVRALVVKAISDELGMALPPLGKFVRDDGSFSTAGFIAYAAVRPWLWGMVGKLSTNSAVATAALCRELGALVIG
jgi:nucleoside phosphorylase